MLILTVGLNVLAGPTAAVFSIAASLMCMIFALGTVSGAHFNPAVTTAIFCSGRGLISAGRVLAYIAAQLCGGILAGFTYSLMQNGRTLPLKPGGGSSDLEALTGKLIFTFLLSFVVLSVATIKSPLSQYFGLAIGSSAGCFGARSVPVRLLRPQDDADRGCVLRPQGHVDGGRAVVSPAARALARDRSGHARRGTLGRDAHSVVLQQRQGGPLLRAAAVAAVAGGLVLAVHQDGRPGS
mmetsp:Transcript_16343/g.49336  ORF Transcript_16343/g.49336 Transcript_16343/m.49336 type:complete len:239 (-) Transcript_16343:32-748(-)